jgi:lipopolysaccharide biosynthesis regulator YciM
VVELAEVLHAPRLDAPRLLALQAEVHTIVEAGVAARQQKMEEVVAHGRRVTEAIAMTRCAICGDTRPQEGWTCPGCGSV